MSNQEAKYHQSADNCFALHGLRKIAYINLNHTHGHLLKHKNSSLQDNKGNYNNLLGQAMVLAF